MRPTRAAWCGRSAISLPTRLQGSWPDLACRCAVTLATEGSSCLCPRAAFMPETPPRFDASRCPVRFVKYEEVAPVDQPQRCSLHMQAPDRTAPVPVRELPVKGLLP